MKSNYETENDWSNIYGRNGINIIRRKRTVVIDTFFNRATLPVVDIDRKNDAVSYDAPVAEQVRVENTHAVEKNQVPSKTDQIPIKNKNKQKRQNNKAI